MCEVLEISTSTYYKYRNTIDPDYEDYIMIKEVFDEFKKTYGYRGIHDELTNRYGLVINHKKVARIMRKFGVVAEYIKKIRINYKKISVEENAR